MKIWVCCKNSVPLRTFKFMSERAWVSIEGTADIISRELEVVAQYEN